MLCILFLSKQTVERKDPKEEGYKQFLGKLHFVRPITSHCVLCALIEPTDALASVWTCSHAPLATQVQQAKYNPGALSGQLAQACPSCAQEPAM